MEGREGSKMSRKTFRILFSILAGIIMALIAMNISLDNEKTWDECYEMTNKRIEWTYAGR